MMSVYYLSSCIAIPYFIDGKWMLSHCLRAYIMPVLLWAIRAIVDSYICSDIGTASDILDRQRLYVR